MAEYPNWVELPSDLMANIFQRLRSVELLNNIWNVCTTWRRICKAPSMWKVINMEKSVGDWELCYDFEMLTKQAVDLSCGELIDISIKGFGSDDLLYYILLRSSNLSRLCLTKCFDMTGSGLSRAVKMVPEIKELYLSSISINGEHIEVIGRNCPHLKSFKMAKQFNKQFGELFTKYDEQALAIANSMPELRHLVLVDSEMTNDGLQAILIGCPHLQFLDVCFCLNLNLDGNLGKLCMERIKDFKHLW